MSGRIIKNQTFFSRYKQSFENYIILVIKSYTNAFDCIVLTKIQLAVWNHASSSNWRFRVAKMFKSYQEIKFLIYFRIKKLTYCSDHLKWNRNLYSGVFVFLFNTQNLEPKIIIGIGRVINQLKHFQSWLEILFKTLKNLRFNCLFLSSKDDLYRPFLNLFHKIFVWIDLK